MLFVGFLQTNTCRWVILLSGMCLLYHKEERTVGLEDDLGINENRIPWLEGYFSDGKKIIKCHENKENKMLTIKEHLLYVCMLDL